MAVSRESQYLVARKKSGGINMRPTTVAVHTLIYAFASIFWRPNMTVYHEMQSAKPSVPCAQKVFVPLCAVKHELYRLLNLMTLMTMRCGRFGRSLGDWKSVGFMIRRGWCRDTEGVQCDRAMLEAPDFTAALRPPPALPEAATSRGNVILFQTGRLCMYCIL